MQVNSFSPQIPQRLPALPPSTSQSSAATQNAEKTSSVEPTPRQFYRYTDSGDFAFRSVDKSADLELSPAAREAIGLYRQTASFQPVTRGTGELVGIDTYA